ncbi:MAG: hypothetical protein QNJ84_04750 [Alphaproteobacteria bacterium]|nr:hypothetical protein [Alphaproteobacteria bacterium]
MIGGFLAGPALGAAETDGPLFLCEHPSRPDGGGAFVLQEISNAGLAKTRAGDSIILGGLDFELTERPSGLARALLASGLGRSLTLCAASRDRYGRLRSPFVSIDGVWLQERLLRAGAARFSGRADRPDAAEAFRVFEYAARMAGRGLWGDGRFRVLPADDPDIDPTGFAVLAGAVRDVARVGGAIFVNFGVDWRSDVTLGLTGPRGPIRRSLGIPSFEALIGQTVEARGSVRFYNGPFMEITEPAQIRLREADEK